MRLSTVLLLLGGVAVLIGLAAPAGAADADDEGRAAYDAACAACHQADALGIPGSFPPLAGNPNVADPAYVESVVRNGKSGPLTVNGETYDGVMAPVTTLSDSQIAAVAAYVAGLAGTAGEPTDSEPPPPPDTGDAAHGEDLYLGAAALANGGPACAACHAAGTNDFLGGAGLGPDLTDVFSRFGGTQGLTAALAAPPSATMTPLFADRPLTDAEIADLTAFFAEVDGTTASGGVGLFGTYGAIGAIALIAFLAAFVRKPRGTYLESLRSAR